MIYQLKTGARLPVKAQVAGEECERLQKEGRLTPENLVDESRPDDAPLHKCFEWDDTVAAERYREDQARFIIRSIEVVVEQHNEPTRAFVPVVSETKHQYESIDVVLRSADSREALLDSARRDLLAFRRKYKTLYELADVFAAIDGALGSQQTLELAS